MDFPYICNFIETRSFWIWKSKDVENMRFHDLICISLIIGESSSFFTCICHLYFLFVHRLFTLFAIGVLIFFILIQKSFFI